MSALVETCSNCRFYRADIEAEPLKMVCKAHPHQVSVFVVGMNAARQPVMGDAKSRPMPAPLDWCGEWQWDNKLASAN